MINDNFLKNYRKSLLKQANEFPTYIKDQRIIYVYRVWNFPQNTKFIILNRNINDSIKSMKNHYGKNLFTENYYEKFSWVSNHFNYKVSYQNYEEYLSIFNNFANNIRSDYEVLDLEFNDSKFVESVNDLSKFLNVNIEYKDIF